MRERDKVSLRTPEDSLEEAKGLAEALNLKVVGGELVHLREINPPTYLGKGKVEEIRNLVLNRFVKLVVVDCLLTPVQQRNLEKAWNCKVIDRTAMIIEIFASRARTSEGQLQVELASLDYQKSRLVRTWTHLERQRGGFGVMAGPGETQLEIDRRLISDRIAKIKKELEKVKKMRALHRKSRKSVPYPIVALVGYTNAGKSTLFNRLTHAEVVAEDKLFATLDPTMRLIDLPSNRKIILSDTVGFISDLPTQLVAAFRATLEEVIEADLIIHVRDISSEMTEAENEDVREVLRDLGLKPKMVSSFIEVYNKIDKLGKDAAENLILNSEHKDYVAISALKGTGCEYLIKVIDKKLASDKPRKSIKVDASNGKLIAWIYEHGEDVKRKDEKDKTILEFSMSEKNLARLKKIGG